MMRDTLEMGMSGYCQSRGEGGRGGLSQAMPWTVLSKLGM